MWKLQQTCHIKKVCKFKDTHSQALIAEAIIDDDQLF